MNLRSQYIGESVGGSVGGILATLNVISGLSGVGLSSSQIVLLALASGLASGLVVASSRYLTLKAGADRDLIQKTGSIGTISPIKSSIAIYLAYLIGTMLLLSVYIFDLIFQLGLNNTFLYTILLAPVLFYLIGLYESQTLGLFNVNYGIETTLIGLISGSLSYIVGSMVRNQIK